MGVMKDRYNTTLNCLKEINKEGGFFVINSIMVSNKLGLTINTMNRHLIKLIDSKKLFVMYKGGTQLDQTYKELIIDENKVKNPRYEFIKNPNDFALTLYSLSPISQVDRDISILKYVVKWSDRNLNHFIKWSNIENTEVEDCEIGMSVTTLNLVKQFIKYMIKADMNFTEDEYEDIYNEFERLTTSH